MLGIGMVEWIVVFIGDRHRVIDPISRREVITESPGNLRRVAIRLGDYTGPALEVDKPTTDMRSP